MLILLPPSEGKVLEGGKQSFRERHPELTPDVKAILAHVKALNLEQRAKFYGAKNAEKASACHALNIAALRAPSMSALERYSGVVYQYLDYPTLKNKRKAKSRIYIVSGLFGAISGGTQIPAYKMPINTWLARYWRDKNAERIAAAAGKRLVLSLLPQAYGKAVALDGAITVDFRVQGGKKAAGHFGKAIKGKFVRFLVESDITDPKDFSEFREEGYRFDGENFIQE